MIDPYRGTGRTSCMLMHAATLAHQGQSVLVVTDQRSVRPTAHRFVEMFRCASINIQYIFAVGSGTVSFMSLSACSRGHRYDAVLTDHYLWFDPSPQQLEALLDLNTLER